MYEICADNTMMWRTQMQTPEAELGQDSEIYLTQEKEGNQVVEAVKESERAKVKITSPGKQVQSKECHVNKQRYARKLPR